MMPQSEKESSNPDYSSRRGSFLKRLFLAFVKLTIIFVVIVALAIGGWLIYAELSRSFEEVSKRIDFNREQSELMEEDIDKLVEAIGNGEQQVAKIQAAASTREAQILDLEQELADAREVQADMRIALEERIDTVLDSTETISNNLGILNEGLGTLQQDITSNVSDIDLLGGELDAIEAEIVALQGDIEGIQADLDTYSAEEFNRMREALALFRLWEMVSRARVRLIEQNLGLASNDIDDALASADRLQAAFADSEEAPALNLELVQQRLSLAAASLPDDPDAAARDLETAWELLDEALTILFGEQEIEEEVTPDETATPEATPSS